MSNCNHWPGQRRCRVCGIDNDRKDIDDLLIAIRDAARVVSDAFGPDTSPSLSALAALADALHAEWKWRQPR